MPELKLYTVTQLRNWLEHNQTAEGLSERIIAPSRAWAIIHNPYVNDEDPVLAALFEDGEVAAFTAAFPEMIGDQRYWWFTSLWCNPKHQGKGYGLIVIGCLAEVYGEEYILDRWGAQETVEIFKHLGAKVTYKPRYIFGSKINRQTAKGKFVHFIRSAQKCLHKLIEAPTKREEYTLRYVSNIDDATYAFIEQHRNQDIFLRTQTMLNWIMQYSFTQACPLIERTAVTTAFAPAKAMSNQMYAVQVWDKERLVGFYILKHTEADLHVLYLYYDAEATNKVFASIRDHVERLKAEQIVTDDEELALYIQKNIYFPKKKVEQIHFAHPASLDVQPDITLQYGDGDGFTAE